MEYQKLLESQNSSYKLDEKSAKFYDDLKRADLEKEQKRINEESERLKVYRDLKAKQDTATKLLSPSSSIPANEISLKPSIIVRKRKNEPKPTSEIQIKRQKDTEDTHGLDLTRRSGESEIDCKSSGSLGIEIRQNNEKSTQTALQGLGDYSSSDDE